MGGEKVAHVFHDSYIAPDKKAPGVFWHYNTTGKYGLYPSNNPLEAFQKEGVNKNMSLRRRMKYALYDELPKIDGYSRSI
jgi:hypothetical protein